jgi:hypothetical protein
LGKVALAEAATTHLAPIVDRGSGDPHPLDERRAAFIEGTAAIADALLFFGEPAEKVCGSKPVHAPQAIMTAPTPSSPITRNFTTTAIRDTQYGSYWSAVFTFETTGPEKWVDKSLIPTTHTSYAAARCPSAIDALCLIYTPVRRGIGVCRAQPPEVSAAATADACPQEAAFQAAQRTPGTGWQLIFKHEEF